MRVALLREYFGRSRFGTILGSLTGIMMLGVMAGPPLAGWVFDKWQSYRGVWFALATLSVVALVSVVTARRPQYSPSNEGEKKVDNLHP